MSPDEIRARTQGVWDRFYSLPQHLGSDRVRASVAEVAPGVRADLEALPADVREHRHRHRQRARQPSDPWARLIARPVPAAVRWRGRCRRLRGRRSRVRRRRPEVGSVPALASFRP